MGGSEAMMLKRYDMERVIIESGNYRIYNDGNYFIKILTIEKCENRNGCKLWKRISNIYTNENDAMREFNEIINNKG